MEIVNKNSGCGIKINNTASVWSTFFNDATAIAKNSAKNGLNFLIRVFNILNLSIRI